MKLKKLLLLLLALVLTAGLIPTVVLASEPAASEPATEMTIPFQVNPIYEDVYTEEDYIRDTAGADGIPGSSYVPQEKEDALFATYVTMEKAMEQIRGYMKSRTETFEIFVKNESSDYQAIGEELLAGAMAHTGNPVEGDYLMWQYGGWSADIYRDGSGGSYNYQYIFTISYYTTAAQEEEMDTAVDNLLKSLNVGSKSDYQKVCAVYDYVCDNVTYDYDNLNDDSHKLKFTAYAALTDKTAVCQGYALLMYRLMLELDVDIRLIAGKGGGEAHGWNIVKLGDVYYNLDSTWDAGVSDYSFFLLNTENFVDHARYLDYMTTQFHTDYPMSATDYVDGVAGEPEYYFVIGGCGNDSYFAIDRDRKLTIAGEGATFSRSELDEMGIVVWDYWTDGFDTVVVEEGITKLGDYAFYDMENVKSVTLPETLTVIGSEAFYDTNITGITLPSSLIEIGTNAFNYCEYLTKIWIPYQVTTIGDGAFWCCYNLKDVTLSSGLTYIGTQAFRETAVTEIVIPDKVTTLGHMAFYYCEELKSVTLGKSMTEIDSNTFGGCHSLEEVFIPEGITKIGGSSFENCWSLSEVTFPASLTDLDGFSGCTGLKKITFQGDAPYISYYAFSDVTATAYYPSNLEGWDEVIIQEFGNANITWVSTHSHEYTSEVTAPTCTEQGYTTYTCSSCGDSYKDDYVEALGHDYGESVLISKDDGHSSECTRCSATKTESCTFENTVVQEATLANPGVMEYTCSVCGGSWQGAYLYRVSGSGRCETAIAAAEEMKAILGVESFDAFILANGDNFADALSGSYLANVKGAPILLYRASGMELNLQYIEENLTAGGTVYILGGTAAVPASVEASLAGYHIVRLAGDTRFDTNLAILNEAGVDDQEILICTGYNYADSLSASATGLPILMVNNGTGTLTESQIAFLESLDGNALTIIGGTAAVSDGLESALGAYGSVARISGSTREETSVLVAQTYFENPGYVVLAYSRNFPDGLCGGPLASTLGAPLILTNAGAEAAAAEYVSTYGITSGLALGGTAALSDMTISTVFTD